MNRQAFQVCLVLSLVGSAVFPGLALLERQAQAQAGGVLYVARGSACGGMLPCYAHLQDAVDAANQGDSIKVAAGTYTDVNDYGGLAQAVCITKTLILRGGYTTTNWTASNPVANPTVLDARGRGRVLYITGEISPTLEGLRITGGNADGLGGGPLRRDAGGGVYAINATVGMRSNQVSSNTADFGGGLYLVHSVVTLDASILTFNRAERDGGAMHLSRSQATLTGNTVSSNTAGRDGGGLSLNQSDISLYGDILSFNIAEDNGGAMYLGRSDATLSGSTVSSNAAFYGGGAYLLQSTAKLSANTVSSNTASSRGGGLYVYLDSSGVLSGNTLSSNTADYGGGMYSYDSTAALSGNTVISNSANDGAGVFLFQSDVTLTNNLMADNRSSGTGSGLYVKGSSCRFLHNTIAGNGSGVYITTGSTPSSVALTNTILASHTVGITATLANTATLQGTLWHANEQDISGDGAIITGTINVYGDPAFVAADAGDYHINPTSPAIDQGVEAGVRADIDHQPRPYEAPDLGADEYWPPGALKHVYLPVLLKAH